MDLGKEQKTIIAGFLIAIILGVGVYAYKHLIFPRTIKLEQQENKIINCGSPVLSQEILVHVEGGVLRPGVYSIKSGSRTIDAIKTAGGALFNSELASLNLAEKVKDGQKIIVPQKTAKANPVQGLVSLNSASAAELDKLPGVGPQMAKRIIEFRNQNGRFSALEDLMKVKGLGKNKFEKLKDQIVL